MGQALVRGATVSVADTSHYIQLDQPAIVIDEIEQLLGVAPASPATPTAPPSAQVQAILDQWTSTGPGEVTAPCDGPAVRSSRTVRNDSNRRASGR